MCDLQYSWYEKQQLRAKIQVQVEEFLRNGGQVKKCKIFKRGKQPNLKFGDYYPKELN